ncbi:hypothetical protein HPB51_006285 [Rhipicephalus microplus]|uniref:SWIM-type domain-containing protein n=1 Tax=Rhipicephalus microplus TaxID=6941 RepID=A0A9J6EM57_RHIMP|nr:hypothetical protein HPB51_006285 [Rhipicephalus microplus]
MFKCLNFFRFAVAVSVSSICKYVNKACERSPCLRDGEAAYEAGDVIECFVEAIRAGRVNIRARVLHPSDPLSPPHRVAVTLEQNDVTEALCTCKAGSYKCGHVVAVLLHLHTQQLLAQPSVQCQGPRVSVKKEKQNKKNESKEKLDLPCIDKERQPRGLMAKSAPWNVLLLNFFALAMFVAQTGRVLKHLAQPVLNPS